jgi:hypothetical protein
VNKTVAFQGIASRLKEKSKKRKREKEIERN